MDKTNMVAYIGGIVRIVTSVLGGYLAQKGLATEAETESIAGAAVLVGTGLWSIWAKRKALAKVPPVAGCFLLCALMLGASGCLTRTRCQNLTFDGCTFRINEPESLEASTYPRSLQIGVNDQQIEGGTDTIASGNKTDPSLQVPMGDSALGYLGSFWAAWSRARTPRPPRHLRQPQPPRRRPARHVRTARAPCLRRDLTRISRFIRTAGLSSRRPFYFKGLVVVLSTDSSYFCKSFLANPIRSSRQLLVAAKSASK